MEQQTLSGGVVQDPWDDPDLLEELYHEKEMSLRQIGEELGCCYTTIHRRMFEYDIEREDDTFGNERDPYAAFHTREDGYEYWSSKTSSVLVHRLLAVSEYGFDAVCDGVVHHENRIRWDNRPDNIELADSHTDHADIHREMAWLERVDDFQETLF